jgi:uncharacterized protein Veg
MGIPYRARVNERWFLNLPGFYSSAFIVAYVEDTADRAPRTCQYCDSDCEESVQLRAADDPPDRRLQ